MEPSSDISPAIKKMTDEFKVYAQECFKYNDDLGKKRKDNVATEITKLKNRIKELESKIDKKRAHLDVAEQPIRKHGRQ